MAREITPEEELANWQELYDEFRKETPSAPRWYQIADMCIGVLMADKLMTLKAQIAATTPPKAGDAG